MGKITMTKSELIERGEEFYETLEFEFRDYDIIEVGKEGFDYYRGSPMYGCLVHVDVNDLSDDEYDEIEETIKGVCNRWDEHTDYGWDDNLGAFWVALYIDEITPDPVVVDDSECPECGASLVENDDGVLYCPYCNPEMEEMEGDDMGDGDMEGGDGDMEDRDGDGDEDSDENQRICKECGVEKEQDDDGNWYCPSCKEEEEEVENMETTTCPRCDTIIKTKFGGFVECPECDWNENEDPETCPNCGEEFFSRLDQDNLECPSCGWEDVDVDGYCPDCGTKLWMVGGIKRCPECEWDEDHPNEDDIEDWYCTECGTELIEDNDGDKYCPECGWTNKLCPHCGEPIDYDGGFATCPNCGWDEDYEGDGEVCPECEKLIIEEDGIKKCPHCDWDERDDWDQDQWNEYYANR